MFQTLARKAPAGWVVAALVLALGAALAAEHLHLPLPWMIGPLFSVAAARTAGLPLLAAPGGRQAGQWAIGTALGLYFTPEVLGHLGDNLLPVLSMAACAVGVGVLSALVIRRWTGVGAETAFFAGLPGGASEMVVLAERQGGAPDRVAAAHALRVMVVVSVVPFVLQHWGAVGGEVFSGSARAVDPAGLPLLVGAALAGVMFLHRLRIANAWVLGPLLCVGALAALQVPLSALPAWAVSAGQLLLGTALGCRFSPEFFRAAPRFLAVSAASTLLALILSAAFVAALGRFVPIPVSSLALAAAPGGMAEMCVTAKVMHLAVPLVTATHVLRVVLLTVWAPQMCGLFLRLLRVLGR